MQLHLIGAKGGDSADAVKHLLARLARKPEDEVHADPDLRIGAAQAAVSLRKGLEIVPAVYKPCRLVVGTLKSQLDGQARPLRERRKQADHVFPEAVRTRRDVQPDDAREGKCLEKLIFKLGDWRVGVRMRLKICYILFGFPL